MEKKILCIAIMGSLLTGCISNKINHAHTTAVNLSQDIDKFVILSNTSIELNKALALKEQDHTISIGLFPQDLSKADRESKVIFTTFDTYERMNDKKTTSAAFIRQNQLLGEYFKNLPLILEDKSVDVAGLVQNIDYLNQVINKNIGEDGQANGGLNQPEKDLITTTLSSGFKFHQYKVYKKAIQEQSPKIIEALRWQKVLFKQNGVLIKRNFLNEKYTIDYKNIEKSLLNKFYMNDDLIERGGKPVPKYNLKEVKSLAELNSQPYIYYDLLNPEDKKLDEPKIKSAAYIKYCEVAEDKQKKDFEDFIKQNENYAIKIKDVSQSPSTFQSGFYDVERNYSKNGDQLICELINIVGLMQENKLDDVKLKDLEKYLSNYDELLKYFSNLYLPNKEDK
ncbi:hypothetical protein E2R16_04870 [Acinetobacter seifertii]|uniref:Uncharacterized protein n=1 Tax=Acinetobacter seifertii TaxID=1530123 RepID=A0A5E9PK98_9GAMM|nr:hypothetical protein [Acinetobacter seifertii]TEU29050.1 hypothetical protein E2R16_04870 [Acinetobacter seifertii]